MRAGTAFRPALLLAGALLACLAPVRASAQTLTMGVAVETTSVDPHYHNIQFNHSTDDHIFDPLTYQAPGGQVVPWLAESWSIVDDTTWEFQLRPGVRFHDGTPLDPDDVAATFRRIPQVQSPSPYTHFIEAVAGYERIDARRFRLRTREPYPFLAFDLTGVGIIPRALQEATTADFNSGKAAIGTGPYRFVRYVPGEVLELARNPDWWGPKQGWERVAMRPMTSAPARVAALVSGQVDLIDRVGPEDVPRLKGDANLGVFTGPAHQVLYLFPDASRARLPLAFDRRGQPLETNPTRDPRVREAISLAINRGGIAAQIMQGGGYPAEQMIAPGGEGRDETLPQIPYQPDRARALLAEAGFRDGWSWTLGAPKGMYQYDDQIAQAVAQGLTRVGIETKVEVLPPTAFYPRINAGAFPIFMTGYLSSLSTTELRTLALSRESGPENGTLNRMGYRNSAFEAVFLRALRELDDGRRRQELAQAMRIVVEDRGLIPVVFPSYIWATRATVASYTPSVLGFTQAMLAKPAKH